MVKITFFFGSYRFSKKSIAWHFLTFRSLFSQLEFVYPPWSWRVGEQMLIFSSGQGKSSWNPYRTWIHGWLMPHESLVLWFHGPWNTLRRVHGKFNSLKVLFHVLWKEWQTTWLRPSRNHGTFHESWQQDQWREVCYQDKGMQFVHYALHTRWCQAKPRQSPSHKKTWNHPQTTCMSSLIPKLADHHCSLKRPFK